MHVTIVSTLQTPHSMLLANLEDSFGIERSSVARVHQKPRIYCSHGFTSKLLRCHSQLQTYLAGHQPIHQNHEMSIHYTQRPTNRYHKLYTFET